MKWNSPCAVLYFLPWVVKNPGLFLACNWLFPLSCPLILSETFLSARVYSKSDSTLCISTSPPKVLCGLFSGWVLVRDSTLALRSYTYCYCLVGWQWASDSRKLGLQNSTSCFPLHGHVMTAQNELLWYFSWSLLSPKDEEIFVALVLHTSSDLSFFLNSDMKFVFLNGVRLVQVFQLHASRPSSPWGWRDHQFWFEVFKWFVYWWR